MILHQKPDISDQDIAAVVDVLKKGIVNCSDITEIFAENIAKYLGAKEVICTSTGTLGLHLALRTVGLNPGDGVIMPTYVCNDVLAAVVMAGGKPLLLDSKEDHPGMNPDGAGQLLRQARAVVVPHLFGQPQDIEPFLQWNIPVIEDCSQSLGAIWKGKSVGTSGDLSTLSFHPLKMITTGEGGAVCAFSDKFAHRLHASQFPDYDSGDVQYHYHLSNMQAALGMSQFGRLENIVQRRLSISRCYEAGLRGIPKLRLPALEGDDWRSACMRYVVFSSKWTFRSVEQSFLKRGIVVRRPVKHLIHKNLPYSGIQCPFAEWHYDHAISLPLYMRLTDFEVEQVIQAAVEILS